jgi:hypothetical protein
MPLKQFDYISITQLENISTFIEYSPYAQDIRIIYPDYNDLKKNDKKGTALVSSYEDIPHFGYEKIKKEEDLKKLVSRGLIIYSPQRRFLRKIGVSFDSENGGAGELPILAYFKEQDNVIKDCRIEIIITSTEDKGMIEIERTLNVIDLLSVGNFATGKYIYLLSPYRGK